ncbi:tripartite tricarboxylate transporter substrate binding protein BugE [soil metagenome]
MIRRKFSWAAALAPFVVAAAFAPSASQAQSDYPNKPIRFIVPYAPGGDADVFTRRVADKLKDYLGQPGIVENRPGALTLIAWQALTSAPPDGYTVLMINHAQALAPAISKSFPEDWYKHVTPLVRTHATVGAFVTGPQAPFKTLDGLIAYAKANPGKVNAGVVGKSIDVPNLTAAAGINVTLIPYKGITDINNALMANEIQLTSNSLGFAKPLAQAGRMVPLAVGTPKRNPEFPDLPAVAETFPGFTSGYWFGFVAPAGTPAPVADKLGKALLAVIATPELQKYFQDQIALTIATGPQETAAFLEAETRRVLKVAREANITAD